MSNDEDDGSYTVGYGKPPAATRFKPGKSGNPKGRPKHRRNLRTDARKVFTDLIAVREGNRTRRVPKMTAILMKQVERALQGDERAAQAATKNAATLGLFAENSGETRHDFSQLTDDELQMLEMLTLKVRTWRE